MLLADQEKTPSQIQVSELRQLLLQHQAIVPIPKTTEIGNYEINEKQSSANYEINDLSH